MKKFLLIGFAIAATWAVKAQKSNLIFFTEEGERFSVVVNGVLQNPVPGTNILLTHLSPTKYKVKIVFEKSDIPEIDKFIYVNRSTESTYLINQNSAGMYALRFLSDMPVELASKPNRSQSVIEYHNEPFTTTTTTTTVVKNNPNLGIGMNIQDPETGANIHMNVNADGMGDMYSSPGTSTTTRTVVKNNPNQGVGVNVQDPVTGANIHMNVNMGGMDDEPGISSSSSTTTTTTTTTRSNGNVITSNTYTEKYVDGDGNRNRHHEHHNPDRYVLQGYNGVYGCQMPMSDIDFESAKKSIGSKNFEDSKLTIAQQIIQSNCLLSSQVKEILLMFTFEDTRLKFAKFAYAYTLDLGNYYKLNDAFTFESSIDELNSYIQGYKKK